MIVNITQHSALTLQEQIIVQVRGMILSGQLEVGAPLPSIRTLALQLKVAINTVQKAYEQLLAEKLIYARVGRGCFVAPLEGSDKTLMAENRFSEHLQQVCEEGKREGLSKKDIQRIFNELQHNGGPRCLK